MAGVKYKDNKPEMEKKRRSRINESLSCLKLLVLGEVRRKNTRISKLDKADILEMAVEYVQRMNRAGASIPSVPPRVDKYRAGFNACAEEVRKHLEETPDVDIDVRTRIVDHLANFVQNLQWLRRHDILPHDVTDGKPPAQRGMPPDYMVTSHGNVNTHYRHLVDMGDDHGVNNWSQGCMMELCQGQGDLRLTANSDSSSVESSSSPADERLHIAISQVPGARAPICGSFLMTCDTGHGQIVGRSTEAQSGVMQGNPEVCVMDRRCSANKSRPINRGLDINGNEELGRDIQGDQLHMDEQVGPCHKGYGLGEYGRGLDNRRRGPGCDRYGLKISRRGPAFDHHGLGDGRRGFNDSGHALNNAESGMGHDGRGLDNGRRGLGTDGHVGQDRERANVGNLQMVWRPW